MSVAFLVWIRIRFYTTVLIVLGYSTYTLLTFDNGISNFQVQCLERGLGFEPLNLDMKELATTGFKILNGEVVR